MLVLLLAIAIPNSKPCSMPQESPATTTRSLHSTIPSRVQMMLVAYLFVDGFLFCLFVSLLFLSRSWPARPQPATRAWTTSANQMQLGYKSAGTFNEPRTQDTSWSPYTAAGRQARKRKRSGKVKPRAHMSTTCDTKKKNTNDSLRHCALDQGSQKGDLQARSLGRFGGPHIPPSLNEQNQ